jgi:hypothetical protein
VTQSSFTSVTTRISSLQGTPEVARQSSINLMITSVKLEEIEQKRQSLKKQCESISLALTEVQNNPPKTLSEEQSREILAHQYEWETQLVGFQKNLVRLDREITALLDTNEDFQTRFRSALEREINAIHDIKNQKISLIMQTLGTQNADIKHHLTKVFNDPQLQEQYFKNINLTENKSFTEKLKNFFKREK